MLKSPCRNCTGTECESDLINVNKLACFGPDTNGYPESTRNCKKFKEFRSMLFGEVTLTGNAWSQAECIITI